MRERPLRKALVRNEKEAAIQNVEALIAGGKWLKLGKGAGKTPL